MPKSLVLLLAVIVLMSGCKNPFANPFGGLFGDDDGDASAEERTSVQPTRVIEPTQKFSLAVGGVYSGRDELVLYDEYGNMRRFIGDPLKCTSSDEDTVILEPREGYETQSAGSGVKMTALRPGIASITCASGEIEFDQIYEVTVPPQSLIQILIAEAGTQITDEATLDESYDEDDVVKLSSVSRTANAVASVIRNRIEIINDANDPSIFEVVEEDYDFDPPNSYYDEVILANGQFSPTDQGDPTFDIFTDAQYRTKLSGGWLIAYDQAVLTAAGIYNGDINDSTGFAFAFRSPTEDEWDEIARAWSNNSSIPEGAGFTDATFPLLAPIQLLIHPDVWTYDDGRPAFIFARERAGDAATITNAP